MFQTSDSTAKLDAALAKAQGKIEAAKKDALNPHFKSKYADLSAVWAAIRPALSENGIAVTQWPVHSEGNRLHLITRLACQGEWMRCEFSIPVNKQDAHGYGSAITYCKRFGLAAAVGVVADDDDDGNGAVKRRDSDVQEPRDQYRSTAPEVAGINGTPKASKAKARPEFASLIDEMRHAKTEKQLHDWLQLAKPRIMQLPEDWLVHFDAQYADYKADLKAEVMAAG